jgi:hypothetical protein
MPSSSFSALQGAHAPAPALLRYRQPQQQPNQGPAPAPAPATDPLLVDPLEEDDPQPPADPDPASDPDPSPADPAPAGSAPVVPEALRAERRKSNELERELRKLRAQLSRFSEINPDEYARLQDAERKREELERQVAERERQLNDANRRKVLNVEKERDDARAQVLNLRKERQLERLFIDAEGRVGGDERGNFFDTFVTLCGGHFQLVSGEGRERLEPIDGKGQPLSADGVALSAADYVEELRRHPVFSFLFQQRGGPFPSPPAEVNYDGNGAPVNLQAMSASELYLAAVRESSPPSRSSRGG